MVIDDKLERPIIIIIIMIFVFDYDYDYDYEYEYDYVYPSLITKLIIFFLI